MTTRLTASTGSGHRAFSLVHDQEPAVLLFWAYSFALIVLSTSLASAATMSLKAHRDRDDEAPNGSPCPPTTTFTKKPRQSLYPTLPDRLSQLPDECIREIVSFLGPQDLWPTCAIISMPFSCNAHVAAAVIEACPKASKLKANFFYSELRRSSHRPCQQVRHDTDNDHHISCVETDVALGSSPLQITSLDLPRVGMGEKGGIRFARALEAFPNLRKCCISSNGLGKETANALSKALISSNVQSQIEVSNTYTFGS